MDRETRDRLHHELELGDWALDAECLSADPEAFFPEKGGSVREAKVICEICPVDSQCLDYALDNDQDEGVWGGVSARDRKRMKRDR